jgi:hypothetical protein
VDCPAAAPISASLRRPIVGVVGFLVAALNVVIAAASRAAAYRGLATPKADEAAEASA